MNKWKKFKIPQSLILIDGMTGAGKTTTSEFLFSKIPRLAMTGKERVKWNISDFERCEKDNVIARKIVSVMVETYLQEGLSVCVEQSFKTEEELKSYEILAEKYSIPIHKFQLIAEPEIAFNRVKSRQEDRVKKMQVPDDRIRRNIGLCQSREHLGFTVIDTSKKESQVVATEVFESLSQEKN